MMFTFLLKAKIIFKVLYFWWKCIYTKDNWYANTNWVKQKVFKSLIWKLVCFRKKVSNIVTISELCVKSSSFRGIKEIYCSKDVAEVHSISQDCNNPRKLSPYIVISTGVRSAQLSPLESPFGAALGPEFNGLLKVKDQ